MGQRKLSALSTAYPSGAVVHHVVANHKTQPSVPLTPERLELIKAYAKLSSSSIEVSKSGRRFFPHNHRRLFASAFGYPHAKATWC